MNDVTPIRHTNSEVDEFLRRGETVFHRQRLKVAEIESDYQLKRTALTVDYSRKLQALANEGAEALRSLELQRDRDVAEEGRKLDALGRLRDG